MLLGQNGGRTEHHHLLAVLSGLEGGAQGHLWATFSRKNHCRSHRTSALSQDRNTPFWRSLCLRFCPANEVHGTVPADRKRVILHCVSGWKWGAS